MVTQIIVPLDQSHVAECAVPYARALARRTNAPIKLLSVVEPSEGELEESSSALSEPEEYLTYIAESIDEVEVEKQVVYGDPVDEVVRAVSSASGEPADTPVLVMATHGRSGLGRVLLGSVALKVAERATCPLFLIRALRSSIASVADISLGKVLVPLDGSTFGEAVLDPVCGLLGPEGTSIHLLRAVELDRSRVTGEPEARVDAEQYLTTMADRFTDRGYTTTWDVVEGDPAQRINGVAGELGADLIALATHGYSGLKRLAIGSVAEEVLNRATRPIVLIRPPERYDVTC